MAAKGTAAVNSPRKLHRKMEGEPEPRDKYFSRAVSKALEALEILSGSDGAMTLNEIAQRIQLSKASAFRLLRTLEGSGYLESSRWGQYSLAPGTSSVVSTQFIARLLRAGAPRIQELSRELHETVSLGALFENRVEVIAVVESSQAIRMSNVVGLIVPPNASSLGKVIAAFQTTDRREKLLRSYGMWRFTEQSITDRNKLDREFDRIRADGFAVDREETVAEGICFGVPVRGQGNEIAAAISTSLPKGRVRDAAHETSIMAALKTIAAQISAELRGESAMPHLPAAPEGDLAKHAGHRIKRSRRPS